MTFDEIKTFVIVMMAMFGGLMTIDKIIDLIKKYKRPSDNIQAKIAEHDNRLDRDEERITTLETSIKETNQVQNRALLQLMNHSIDGNHTDKLIAARDEMETYLINH